MKILLLTPPMTQLNTPYPATAYLSGFLHQQGYQSTQRDFAIELLLRLLSKQGINDMYGIVEEKYATVADDNLPDSVFFFFSCFDRIRQCIEPCLSFLQGKDPSLAMRIASRDFLPEGPQFGALYQMESMGEDVLEQAFGALGVQDKAKYIATLFLNDVIAFISESIDLLFSAARYGEQLAASNPSFDELYQQLQSPPSYVRTCLQELVLTTLENERPDVIAITIPFPGNMLGALQIGEYCKQWNPECTVVIGGGYINTELRNLQDSRVFEFVDYITLDDGERPLLSLLQYLEGATGRDKLYRTYCLANDKIQYFPAQTDIHDFPHKQTGTPTYSGLQLNHYLSLCDMLNPMHRIWSDTRWNKLTVAHGCYWKKCSFCDISLDYIGHYDEAGADIIIDRIEALIAETGQRGFHFVDEAAPPKVLFALAQKLIDRQIVISWWGNIRFEKTFSADKCQLLADSGCIAVSGGLEVASNRLLKLMQKGVSVQQVARVTRAFSDTGILVHAYLMYGFPSQTETETIDALEMVRQMMSQGCFQSAYWHRFAATIHSPVGQYPDRYGIKLIKNKNVQFAENDVDYIDPVATDHVLLGAGLNKALYNYMHGMGFEHPVSFWFDKSVAETTVPADFIENALNTP